MHEKLTILIGQQVRICYASRDSKELSHSFANYARQTRKSFIGLPCCRSGSLNSLQKHQLTSWQLGRKEAEPVL